MAIPEDVKPFLEGFTADEVKFFDNLLTKSPKLAEGWLRQSDYDRNLNKSKADVETAKNRAKSLEDWYAENEPVHKRSLERAHELEVQYQELQKKLTAAEAARAAAPGGDQVNAEELKQRVEAEVEALRTKFGFVTSADKDKIIADQTSALETAKTFVSEAQKKFYEETLPASVNFAADVAEICVDHKGEFKESLDRKKLAEYMAERKILDPKAGYAEFVKPRRDEVKFNQRLEEELKQRMSGIAIAGGTVAPGGGIMPKGALQMKVDQDNASKGSNTGVLAAQAAAELRSEGKF